MISLTGRAGQLAACAEALRLTSPPASAAEDIARKSRRRMRYPPFLIGSQGRRALFLAGTSARSLLKRFLAFLAHIRCDDDQKEDYGQDQECQRQRPLEEY